MNVLIGVGITSLDEARPMEADEEAARPAEPPAAGAQPPYTGDPVLLRARVAAARRALDDLERALADTAPGTGPPDPLPGRPPGGSRTVASSGG